MIDFNHIYHALCESAGRQFDWNEENGIYSILDPTVDDEVSIWFEGDLIVINIFGRIMDYVTGVTLKILKENGGITKAEVPSFAEMTYQNFLEKENIEDWLFPWSPRNQK
jgi:hypothetical protein